MIFTSSLIKCLLIFTLLIFSQIHLVTSKDNIHEWNDIDSGDDFYEKLPSQQQHFQRENFRRASLRYHPHVLYKKASLRPIIGQNGKVTFTKRDRLRRSLSSLINSD